MPGGILFPVLGILSCLWLMLSLPVLTWIRFLVWLDIGIMIYWFYGRIHSPLANRAERARRTAAASAAGNFLTMAGLLTLFNGLCMTLLAYMTEFGVTTEVTAKWNEIGVTPEAADSVGLAVLGVGAVVWVIGRVLARSSATVAGAWRRTGRPPRFRGRGSPSRCSASSSPVARSATS